MASSDIDIEAPPAVENSVATDAGARAIAAAAAAAGGGSSGGEC